MLLGNRLMIDIERMRSRSMDFRSQIVRHETRLPQITNDRHRMIETRRIEEYTVAAGALDEAIAILSHAVDILNEHQGG